MFKCKTKNLHKRIGLTERVVCLYIRMCIAWKQWLQAEHLSKHKLSPTYVYRIVA